MNTPLDYAHHYASLGFSVIPIKFKTKEPLIPWKEFQNRRATEEEITSWWQAFPEAQVAIITGNISNLAVVDIDPRNGGNDSLKRLDLPLTFIVKTGGGGWHYYYRLPPSSLVTKKTGLQAGIDIQAEGAYVIAPPSIHPNGSYYEYSNSIEDLADAPSWIFEEVNKQKINEVPLWKEGLLGAASGMRNKTAASYIGKILSGLPYEMWESAAWPMFVEWNKSSLPPLDIKELKNVFDSIAKKAINDKDKAMDRKSQQLDTFVTSIKEDIECFCDELGVPWVRLKNGNHHETYTCDDKKFLGWLLLLFRQKNKRILTSEEQKRLISNFESEAFMNSERHMLTSRIAMEDGSIYYDLGNSNWNAIKIESSNWEEITCPPVYFKRATHQLSQVYPSKDSADPQLFLKYINIKDEGERKLFLISLIVAFIPTIARPIFVLHGEQGSAKSTLSRFCKQIIDPGELDIVAFPTKDDDLIVQLSRSYAIFYDNISSLNQSLSDVLCRAVTGSAVSKRKLYTNDQEYIIKTKRFISINGINQIIQRLDLLDRSLIFELQPIPEENRKPDNDLKDTFEKELPSILGGIFNVLSTALALERTYKKTTYPRMAEYAKWGALVSEAIGYGSDFFEKAYEENRVKQGEAVADLPIINAIEKFAELKRLWSGTMSDLLKELKNLPTQNGWSSTDEALLPKQSNYLSREINRFQPHLRKMGINITKLGERHYQIIYSPLK